ncbi:IS3 family transposase, partial [Corynebacterium sp. LK2510]|uniref:IS3 family transposase n=1 Tax=Corynebacterium sp. LK2510 TaxID=3110472 RepID=UPI0034CF80FD
PIDTAAHNTYGYRRMWWELRHRGITISENIVRRLTGEESITPRYPQRRWTYSSYQGDISPAPDNLLRRRFHATRPNTLWLTDISVFPSNQARVYLSVMIDCVDGTVVAAKTRCHPTME